MTNPWNWDERVVTGEPPYKRKRKRKIKTMTPDPISEEARKCFEEMQMFQNPQNQISILQRHMDAYAIAYHEAKSKELVKALQETTDTLKAARHYFEQRNLGRPSENLVSTIKWAIERSDAARKERE